MSRNRFAHLGGYAGDIPPAEDTSEPAVDPLPCRVCDGDGDTPSGGDCPRCDGDGEEAAMACAECEGDGELSGGTCGACLGQGSVYEDGRPYEGGQEQAAAFSAVVNRTMAKVRPGMVANPEAGMTPKARRAAVAAALKPKAAKATRREAAAAQSFGKQMKAALAKIGRS